MARDRELALRIRLVPDTEAIVGRSGVHFIRGREAFFLDRRGVAKLVDLYDEILSSGGFDELGAVLPPSNARTSRD